MHSNLLKTASLLRRAGVLTALGLAAAVTVADTRRVASPIVVNSAADVADLGDGICETASGNGVCTLWAKGIIAGCSATTYCPTATVSRDQMAKFLVNGFQLVLYGP